MKNLLIIFFIVLGIYFYRLSTGAQDSYVDNSNSIDTSVNSLIINKNDNSTYNIAINEPTELDFLSKRKVLDLRKKYAALNPAIIPSKYTPSGIVFGQITDGKPWWGLKGMVYKGAGQNSIDGLSEETRFINNPLLLLGVDSFFNFEDLNIDGPEIYIKPLYITVEPSKKTITVIYDYSGYKSKVIDFLNVANPPVGHFFNTNHFGFEGINARDFGYNYVYAYSGGNINFDDPNSSLFSGIHQLRDYIHTGGSCGYPGNCNNASPYQGFLDFSLSQFDSQNPSEISMKLWKKQPLDTNSPADLYYIVKFQ